MFRKVIMTSSKAPSFHQFISLVPSVPSQPFDCKLFYSCKLCNSNANGISELLSFEQGMFLCIVAMNFDCGAVHKEVSERMAKIELWDAIVLRRSLFYLYILQYFRVLLRQATKTGARKARGVRHPCVLLVFASLLPRAPEKRELKERTRQKPLL